MGQGEAGGSVWGRGKEEVLYDGELVMLRRSVFDRLDIHSHLLVLSNGCGTILAEITCVKWKSDPRLPDASLGALQTVSSLDAGNEELGAAATLAATPVATPDSDGFDSIAAPRLADADIATIGTDADGSKGRMVSARNSIDLVLRPIRDLWAKEAAAGRRSYWSAGGGVIRDVRETGI